MERIFSDEAEIHISCGQHSFDFKNCRIVEIERSPRYFDVGCGEFRQRRFSGVVDMVLRFQVLPEPIVANAAQLPPDHPDFAEDWGHVPDPPSAAAETPAMVGVCPDCKGEKVYRPLIGPPEPCRACCGGASNRLAMLCDLRDKLNENARQRGFSAKGVEWFVAKIEGNYPGHAGVIIVGVDGLDYKINAHWGMEGVRPVAGEWRLIRWDDFNAWHYLYTDEDAKRELGG